MQPRMKGGPRLSGCHEQPHRKRQNCRCGVKTLSHPAIYLTLLVLQTICKLANSVPPARLIFEARLCNQDIPSGFKRCDRSFCRTTTCQSNTPPRFPIKRPEAFRFEPLKQTRYYYGRMWGLLVRVLSEQSGLLPTVVSV